MNINNLVGLILIVLGVTIVTFGSLLGALLIIMGVLLQLKGRGIIKNVFCLTPENLIVEGKMLRVCIVTYWVIVGLMIITSSYEDANLPLEVIQFIDSQLMPNWVLVGGTSLLLVHIAGSIGVFCLKPWGRLAYTTSIGGLFVLMPFTGSTVVTPLFGSLDSIQGLLGGTILCLLYFSPAKKLFNTSHISD